MIRLLAHIGQGDWTAIGAGAAAGVICALSPTAIALFLRWLA